MQNDFENLTLVFISVISTRGIVLWSTNGGSDARVRSILYYADLYLANELTGSNGNPFHFRGRGSTGRVFRNGFSVGSSGAGPVHDIKNIFSKIQNTIYEV